MSIFNNISGAGDNQQSGDKWLATIEGHDEDLSLLGSSDDLLGVAMDLIGSIDEKISTTEGYSEDWQRDLSIADMIPDALALFGNQINTTEGLEEAYNSIKSRMKSAKRRVKDLVRSTKMAAVKGMNAFKSSAEKRTLKISALIEESAYVASKDRKMRNRDFHLKGVRQGLSDAEGKFNLSVIKASIKRSQEIVDASIKINKDISSAIDELGSAINGNPDDWYDSGWESCHDSVKKLFSTMKKIGGGSVERVAAKKSASKRAIPGGDVYSFGPFFNGRIIEMLVDTSNHDSGYSRLSKIRTVPANGRDRSEFGEAEIECLTLSQVDSLAKSIEALNAATIVAVKEGLKADKFYNSVENLLDRVSSESMPGGPKGEHAKGLAKMIKAGVAMAEDLLAIHGVIFGRSLSMTQQTIDAVITYSAKSLADHK